MPAEPRTAWPRSGGAAAVRAEVAGRLYTHASAFSTSSSHAGTSSSCSLRGQQGPAGLSMRRRRVSGWRTRRCRATVACNSAAARSTCCPRGAPACLALPDAVQLTFSAAQPSAPLALARRQDPAPPQATPWAGMHYMYAVFACIVFHVLLV